MNSNPTRFADGAAELSTLLQKEALNASKVFVLCDSNTLQHCWPLVGNDEAFQGWEILEVEPGEGSKSIEVAAQLWHAMIELEGDRSSLIINLGGGVVTDLGGFIASTFKRGIRGIHVPTSLLGMVDASIGGKTGINLGHHKNQVGTFEMAIETIICPDFLDSVPGAELLSGFAEMIKHGYVSGKEHLSQIRNLHSISAEEIKALVKDSVQTKLDVVRRDAKESGERKKLNFGHTIGHAIESYSHEHGEPLTHGHCVALGMKIESAISFRKELCSEKSFTDIAELIDQLFPASPFELTAGALWPYVLTDKKNRDGKVMMVGLKSPGELIIDVEIQKQDLAAEIG